MILNYNGRHSRVFINNLTLLMVDILVVVSLWVLIVCDTRLVQLQIWMMNLLILMVILNMKNHRLLLDIALIQRLFRNELKIARCTTWVVNVFQYHQLLLHEMLFQFSRLLLLTTTFKNLLQVFFGFNSCERVVSGFFFSVTSSQTFGTFPVLLIAVAVLILISGSRGTFILMIVLLRVSLIIRGRIVLNLLLFLFLQTHYLTSWEDLSIIRCRLCLL